MAGLQVKHHKALDLIEENTLSLPEIARAVGISYSYLRRLYEGDAESGNMGQLFHGEVNKIYKRIDKRSRKTAKKTKDLLFKRLERWARELPVGKLKDPQVRRVLDALNTLAKSTPQFEINAVTQIYNQMNERDLLDEFKKLSTLATLALNGSTIQGVGQGESGEISRLIRHGGSVPKDSEDSILRASSEAGGVPQEPSDDTGNLRGE